MQNLRYSTQTITEKDIQNVKKVLKSDFLTQGPNTQKFEKKIRALTGSKYCLAVNSGSSALFLACKALSLKKGDHFWTVPNSFVATANCGVLCDLKIDFVTHANNDASAKGGAARSFVKRRKPRILVSSDEV